MLSITFDGVLNKQSNKMKQIFLVLLYLMAYAASSFSQDLIYKKDGSQILCKIQKEDSTEVYFSFVKNGSTLETFLKKSEVQLLKYGGAKVVQEGSSTASTTAGIGLGMQYGGIGANFMLSPNNTLGIFVGVGYKMFGLYDAGGTGTLGSGSEVAEYKVKYRLPYYGLAAEMYNQKFGISIIGKYGFCGHADDLDNHVLHSRTNYADYDGDPNVFMSNITLFWNFHKNWEAKFGADITLIRINGHTWDETHNPAWDKDQNIDTKQFIYWVGLGYKF